MGNCSKHKREIGRISNMKKLADKVGNLHYETLTQFLYHLSEKIKHDAEMDNEAGREKLASALQYTGMSLFESSLRMEKVWLISEPFMKQEIENL